MLDSPAEAARELAEYFDAPTVVTMVQALQPAISLDVVAVGQGAPGASRLGGRPDLPKGTAWPRPAPPADATAITRRGNGYVAEEMRQHLDADLPYAFIAQIDLADAARLGKLAGALPASGRLLFFYDLAIGPFETGTRPARVIYDDSPRDALAPVDMPPELVAAAEGERREREAIRKQFKRPEPEGGTGTVYGAPPRMVKLRVTYHLPDRSALEFSALPKLANYRPSEGIDQGLEELLLDYDDARSQLDPRGHRLLGSPQPEQDDPRYDAVVVTEFGKEHLSREAWQANRERIMAGAHAWKLLLQVHVPDWLNDGMSEGTVFFLIRDEDLAARRFEKVVAVYQQT